MTTKSNLVKMMLMSVATAATMTFTACSNDDDVLQNPEAAPQNAQSLTKGSKTVLIYMAGKNNLSSDLNDDLHEIQEGSKRLSNNDNLLVFVRRRNVETEEPWLARVKNGEIIERKTLSDLGITSSDDQNRASDPVVMEGVMRYAFNHYPASAGNYGLVLWGHGSGWLINEEVKRANSRGYGVDEGVVNQSKDKRWINIPTLAKVLKNMPHLKFIMGDCCHLMCLENLYELRYSCDYIIGSPAEIPNEGAPYDQIVPDMFAGGQFYSQIIDKYYTSQGDYLPLAAVKTSEMDQMAQATRRALQIIKEKLGERYADLSGIIHYGYDSNGDEFESGCKFFFDAGDFIRTYAPQDVYEQWRQALDRTVVESRMSDRWRTERLWSKFFGDFLVTKEKFHGVSMFVPQDPSTGNYAKYNEDIKQLSWHNAVY